MKRINTVEHPTASTTSEQASLLIERTLEAKQIHIQSIRKHILSTSSGIDIVTIPNVPMNSIVGLEEVKEEIMSVAEERGGFQRLLLFGPVGSGKAHFVRAVATELNANLICLSRVKSLHEWIQNIKIYSQVICDICKEQSSLNKRSILFLNHVDFYCGSSEEHSKALVFFLRKVQAEFFNCGMKLAIIGTTFQPKVLPKSVVGCFNRRVYIPTLNVYERKELLLREIPNVWKVGHLLTEEDLNVISSNCFSIVAAGIHTLICNACRVQNPKALMMSDADSSSEVERKFEPVPLMEIRPLIISDFDNAIKHGFLRLDAQTFKEFQDFYQTYEGGKIMSMQERESGITPVQFKESIAALSRTQLAEMEKKRQESWFLKLFSWL